MHTMSYLTPKHCLCIQYCLVKTLRQREFLILLSGICEGR